MFPPKPHGVPASHVSQHVEDWSDNEQAGAVVGPGEAPYEQPSLTSCSLRQSVHTHLVLQMSEHLTRAQVNLEILALFKQNADKSVTVN